MTLLLYDAGRLGAGDGTLTSDPPPPVCVSLSTVACPLLLFWPLVCEVRGGRAGRAGGEDGEDAVMEMRLRENPRHFSSALLQLSTRYLFILGAQVRALAPIHAAASVVVHAARANSLPLFLRSLRQSVPPPSSGGTSWCGRSSRPSKCPSRRCGSRPLNYSTQVWTPADAGRAYYPRPGALNTSIAA